MILSAQVFLYCQFISLSFSSVASIFFILLYFSLSLKLKSVFLKTLIPACLFLPYFIFIFFDLININLFGNFNVDFLTSYRLSNLRDVFILNDNFSFFNIIFGFFIDDVDNTWVEFLSYGVFGIILYFSFIKNYTINKYNAPVLIFTFVFGNVENLISISIPLLFFAGYILQFKYNESNKINLV